MRLGVGITAALKLCTGGRPQEGSIGWTRTYPRFKYPSIETSTCQGKTSGFRDGRGKDEGSIDAIVLQCVTRNRFVFYGLGVVWFFDDEFWWCFIIC